MPDIVARGRTRDARRGPQYRAHMATRPGVLAGIGNTPIVRLSKLVPPGAAEVWVKLEAANPTGSYKDRMALAMIEGAEQRGDLQPGGTVVEYTGGSTGSSLALVCSVKGYRLRIVTSDAFALEKLRTMAAFGAELEIIPSAEGIHPGLVPAMRARAAEIVAETGAYATDQFNNRDALVGYRGIGSEAVAQLDGTIDAVCIYAGVGGCLIGTSEGVATRWPDVHRVVVEPAESAVLSGRPPGTHRIEGGGVGFVPPHLQPDEHGTVPYDEVIAASTADAFAMARRAAAEEGIWGGPSGGANLIAAIRTAERLGEGRRVLTVQCDSGMKYLNGDLYA
jgi:cysteine synthase